MSRVVEVECLSAFQNGHKETAIRLLPLVVNVHKLKSSFGQQTILHFACSHGWIEIVMMLINKYQFDPMCRDNAGNTSLHMACCSKENLSVIQYLIRECYCNPVSKNDNGNTPLHLACINEDIKLAKYLINECHCDPMSKNNDGNTPLHLACSNRDVQMVHYLISDCKCDSMSKNKNGDTLLHLACSNTEMQMVRYLISDCKCNPMSRNDNGNTPLHLACSNRDMQMARYLISEYHCDPMSKNDNGNTPLHLACSNKDMQMARYLISEYHCDPMSKNDNGNTLLYLAYINGDIKMAQYLMDECQCDPSSKNNEGNTLLHLACIVSDTLMVRYLISECHCDPMSENNDGNTPLHLACSSGYKLMVHYLISECHCDLMCENNEGNTPLHIACQHCLDNTSIIEELISTGKIAALNKNKFGSTPLMLVPEQYKENVKAVFAKFGRIQTSHPVHSYVNVVLLGNPGVGKSTLAQVIIQRSSGVFASVRGLFQPRYVKGVELRTAGIIPSKLEHRELGNVILHDSAGQSEYYSSHIAVLENLLHGTAAVFIIVVSLSEKEVFKHLHHWLTIVENESHKALGQCHVVIVASHIDEVDQKDRPCIYRELADITSLRLSQQSGVVNCGLVSLDCRRLVGGELSSFTTTLSSACQSIRSANTREMSLYCHMLFALLDETKESVYTLDQLRTLVIESEEYYVPAEVKMISELLSSLHATGLIVFLKNIHTPGNSWIVSRKGVLLTEINGVLFAPENFKQHHDIASNTGIIIVSTLSQLFPQYSSEMLVLFLQYMELCQEVSQDFLSSTNLMVRHDESSDETRERLLFFPALIRHTERPQEISGTFQFGWCLQCSNPHQFFLPRFLHVLLLHLAFLYALPKSTENKLHRRCTIWTSGIQWKDTRGVQSLVELVDNSQCVLLLMSCQVGSEQNMLRLCKDLLCEILSLQQQLCPSLKLQEFVIDPSQLHYPIQKPSTLTLYDIELIASCIIQKEQFVLDTEGDKQMKMSDLFSFEPIQPDTLSVFAGRNPEDIANNLIRDPTIKGISSEHATDHKDVQQILSSHIETSEINTGSHTSELTDSCTGSLGLTVPNSITPIQQRDEREHSSSPKNILTRHLSDMTDVVLDPEKLANDLHSAGLITFHMKDRVFTISSYPLYEKVSILLVDVWRLLRGDNNPEKLEIFSDVLKKQNDDKLTEITQDMLRELGSSHSSELPVPSITPTQHELLDSTIPLPNIQSMTSSNSFHHTTTSVEDNQRDEREHLSSPKNILTRHLSDITDVVLDPEKLANDLHSAGLITFHMKDRVLNTSSYSRYEKVSILLVDVWRLLRGDNGPEKLVMFCDVLKSQSNETLTGIIQNILRELEIKAISRPVQFECLRAFEDGCRETAIRLLPLVVNVHKLKSSLGQQTVLHWACYHGWIDIVMMLINTYQFDPMHRDCDGNTSLHMACSKKKYLETIKNLEVVQYLIIDCDCDSMSRNNDGNTPLHLAYINRDMQIVDCLILISEWQCDPMSRNNEGNTLLHLACSNGDIKMARYLINECHCDPAIENNNGKTVLHLACRNSDMQMVRCLISECNCDPMSKNKNGNTLLHLACSNANMKMVRYLISECHCDPMNKNKNGNTVLHLACIVNHTFMVRYLINECHCDPMIENNDGNTVLHIACQHCGSYTSIIKELVSTGKIDPLTKNKLGLTPLMLVPEQQKEKMKAVLAKFGKIQISHPVNSYVNAVLLGNPGVGKSTLAQVIIQRSSGVFASVRGLFQYVKGVELCTAGIIPSKLEHRELGNVILHDSAGQSEYYSSHIAVLENLLHGSAAVFVIIVRLSEKEVYKHLHHWLTIVENESQKALGQCHVVIVASHIEEVVQKDRPGIYRELADITSSRLSQQNGLVDCGLVPLDCRRLVGGELSSFTTTLSSACQSIRSANTREMSLYCHMLFALLDETKESVYTLDHLRTILIESEEYYVPAEVNILFELLSSLHATGLIVFLKNIHTQGNSWIVSRKGVLLTEINGVLFAPENFKQHRNVASNTGIITLSTLSQIFQQYSSDMLVLFLQYMELCQEISQDFLTSTNLMTRGNESSDEMREILLFFPALIRNTERSQEISGTFQFGWCLQCSNPHHFFLPRFLHVLLLHLAFRYALPKSTENKLHRRCTIWTSGIQWKDTRGVQSLVELVDNNQCVLLLMSCQVGSEQNMLRLCKDLLCEILSLQQQLCPSLKLQEFIIDPSQLHYPIEKPSTLTLYDIELIASCIIQKEQFVLDTEGDKQMKISDLFPFEPIQPDTLSVFAGRNPEDIAKNLIRDPTIMRISNEQATDPCKESSHIPLPVVSETSQITTGSSSHTSEITVITPTQHELLDSTVPLPNIQSVTSSTSLHHTTTSIEDNQREETEHLPSPKNILTRHLSDITDVVLDPEKLANDLHSASLITFHMKDRVLTTLSYSRYDKVSKLVNDIWRLLEADNDPKKLMMFCDVLKKQNDDKLTEITQDMLRELGVFKVF